MTITDPHGKQPIVKGGTPLDRAAGALILLHGRGGTAEDILSLGKALADDRFALLAPQAADQTWYPYSFLAPRRQNEPYLSSALSRVEAVLALAIQAGIPAERVAVCGFSQGACLATEFVGRHPQRYAALLAFTGGLIGPMDEPITLTGDLGRTAALFSSGDPDPHVPWERVSQSADLLVEIGAQVFVERYPGRPHTILSIEVERGKELLSAMSSL
jgi:phospholipase/carboxylesterase